jgi:hypothetical protein
LGNPQYESLPTNLTSGLQGKSWKTLDTETIRSLAIVGLPAFTGEHSND